MSAVCLATFAGSPAALHAAPKRDFAEVIANSDLTEDGKKLPPPSPEKPVYYAPVIFGWHESGKIVAGEEPPKRQEMLRLVAQALAREGYVLQALRPDANTTLPSLVITVEWGCLNPDVIESGALNLTTGDGGTMSSSALRSDPTQNATTDFNQREMIALVAGSAIKRQASFSENEWARLRDAVGEGRYYIIVTAYDFAASAKGEQTLLWRARMSTPRQGVWMSDIVPALVAAGAPLFGRQSDIPKWTKFAVRDGKVIIGDPVFLGYEPAKPEKKLEKESETKAPEKK